MGSVAYDNMGNICAFLRKEKKKNQPPQTLEDLLKTVPTQEPIFTSEVIKNVYTDNLWLQRFDDYLKKQNLPEMRACLEFLVFTQYLYTHTRGKRKSEHSVAKVKDALSELTSSRKRDLFLAATDRYILGNDGEDFIIVLDNSMLFNDLSATNNALTQGLPVSEKSVDEILDARNDLDLWSNGVDKHYKFFLNNTSINTVQACLLSLL
eukprot:TRINITY_DN43054_c0_g1_i1.p1 TRINITY_DN43054_c0_g1~~TRINITY_DN43054_c0_g1_i1.p1  ORF type:complete len:208 (-),score=24.67 TRINITY_DN43054_c0_g1_i1:181-804(-)